MKFIPKTQSGFVIDKSANKITSEASPIKVLPLLESANNGRLLIISNTPSNELIPYETKKRKRKPKKLKQTTNRKRVIDSDTFTHCGKTYPINNGKGKVKKGLYVDILQRIFEQFEICRFIWGRVFVLRYELHLPYETKDNQPISYHFKRLVQKLEREYGFKDIGYCWARERHGDGRAQHYHCVLFLDGNVIRHSSRINEIIKQLWESQSVGYTIGEVKKPYYFVDSEKVAQEAMLRVSYLAKTRGKGCREKQTKDYSCSRLNYPK